MGTDVAGHVVLAERVVEVLHNQGNDASPRWSSGSGFIMRGALVLTAAHVVGPAGELLVRFRGVEERPARICTLPDGGLALDDQLDLAVLEILDAPGDASAVAVARLRDNPTLDVPNLDGCVAFGFPAFEQRTRPGRDRPVRESVRVDGYIPMGQGAVEGLATLRIRDAPQHPSITPGDLSRSPWRGISGAVVFAGAVAIGVISEHHPPAGLNGLTVVPLAWLDRRPDAAAWWALLGVADPASVPHLPAGPGLVSPDAEVERRYRELLLRSPEFARLPTPFEALPPAFYVPRLLRAADAPANGDDPVRSVTDVMTSVHRLVVVAPAGMGKTEFLHDIVRRVAGGDGDSIPVFVRLHDLARRGEGHDLLNFAVIESFGDLVDRSEVEQIVGMLRRRREQSVSDVVFLFDGLDEVPVSKRNDVLARVRKVDRFVLTSRPSGRIDVLQDGPTYWIDGLNDEAVGHFIDRWEARDPEVRVLLDRLAEDPRLGELAQFPQLLVLLCWLWRPVSAGARRSRAGIIATAVDEAFGRAVQLAGLPDASEEVVPAQARSALQQAALEAVSTGEGDRMDISRRHMLTLMEEAGGQNQAALLLGFARRTGLLVPGPAGDDLWFLHQAFRAHLAGEALVAGDDPIAAVDRLAFRRNGDDTLAAAAALEPERMPALILDRLAACREDLFRMNRRSAAVCLEGLTDLRPLEERLRPVADAVLEGAREWWSRHRFAPAIGYLRTDYMRTRLRESLSDDDPYLRWAAVEGLRHMGEPEAVRLLVDRLPGEPWQAVQRAIVIALGRLRDPAAVGPLWAHYERCVRDRAGSTDFRAMGESLGRLGAEPQLRSLIDRLDDEEGALEVLMGARPFVPPQLGDEITRCLGARVILTAPEDVQRYLATADDPTATTAEQLEAIDGLGAVGTGETAGALLWILITATADQVRERAAEALRDLEGDPGFGDVVEHVAKEFWSPDPADRDRGALEFLLLWTSPAQDELVGITFPEPDQRDDELARDADSRVRATAALMACLAGQPPPELLTELAGDQDGLVRETAVAALGRLPGDDGADLIARLAVQDTEHRVRMAALRALGRLAPAGTVDVAGAVLDFDQPDERAAAAAVLSTLGDQAAIGPILRRLRAEEVQAVRWALIDAAIALTRPDPVPSDIAEAIGAELNGNADARMFGAHAAGQAELVETSAQLRELMGSDPNEEVRDEAAEAYGRVAALDALLGLVDELTASEPTSERMSAIACALRHRSRDVIDELVLHIAETGGRTIVTERAVIVWYPTYTYNLLFSAEPRDVATLLDALTSLDAGDRWNAVDELADWWREPGVLGRIAVAVLDPHICVAERAAGIIRKLADTYQPDAMDDESRALLGHPDHLAGLIELLESSDSPSHVRWLLTHVEFMPTLLRAAVDGRHAVRPMLWDLADRHGMRLFPDGTAVLATGREVRWDDLSGAPR